MFHPNTQKRFRSRSLFQFPVVGGAAVAAIVYFAGLSMADQIATAEIRQRAFATAQCGNPVTNLQFAEESRVVLFARDYIPKVLLWAAIAGGTVATFFLHSRRSRQELSDTEKEVLIDAALSSGLPISQLIEIINGVKPTN